MDKGEEYEFPKFNMEYLAEIIAGILNKRDDGYVYTLSITEKEKAEK